jgi:hypothetical protein
VSIFLRRPSELLIAGVAQSLVYVDAPPRVADINSHVGATRE